MSAQPQPPPVQRSPRNQDEIDELRDIAIRLVNVADKLRVPDDGRMLLGAWTATLGGMSDACEGLSLLLEVLGQEPSGDGSEGEKE